MNGAVRFGALAVVTGMAVAAFAMKSAVAADMPVKAPVAATANFSWTGFYVGGHIGGGWESHTTTNVGAVNSANFPAGTTNSEIASGFIGGVQAGYDWQFHSNWLVGVAADFSWSDIDGNATNVSAVNPAFATHPHTHYNWLTTATARVGHIVNNWLLYAKGGAAWAEHQHNAFTTNGAGATVTLLDGSETRSGWTIGAGSEFRINRNWSALIEYNYIDLGTSTLASLVTLGATAPVVTGATVLRDNTAHIHLVKAGVNYRF
jgi:outer membrane immunogenic protein